MYQPNLTDEERELVDKLRGLPKDRFKECMFLLDLESYFNNMEYRRENSINRVSDKPDILQQGRIRAEHYDRMRLATAKLELEQAKEELIEIYKNWNELEHDAPIYWDHIKTKDGEWKDVLVGTAARDYDKEGSDLTLPNGEVIDGR